MHFTVLGIVILVIPLQLENASLPIDVTEEGIVTEASLTQSLNAQLPISVTELGIVTEVRP